MAIQQPKELKLKIYSRHTLLISKTTNEQKTEGIDLKVNRFNT